MAAVILKKQLTKTHCDASEGPIGSSPAPFRRVLSVLSEIFDVSTGEQAALDGVTDLKGFCVDLLEGKKHAWRQSYQRLGEFERIQLAGSLFLSRKLLPQPPDPTQSSRHERLMKTPAPPPPPGFLEFAKIELARLFPRGWDRKYDSHVYKHTPLESACLEFGRKKGGSRAYAQLLGRECYQDQCLGGQGLPSDYGVRFSVVRTKGKNRGVTVSSGAAQALAPLHRTIYDWISSSDWCLRGDAKPGRFSRFRRVEGEVFVSGDYESATDGLSCEVAEFILGEILSRSSRVPEGIKEYAQRSLRAIIFYGQGRVTRQARGQLMGNFLSFPLLCLQNYLAFRFLVPRPVPVKINGDDIVFRCLPAEYETWREGLGALGLKLCHGKTMVNPRFFSLNSAFFSSSKGGVGSVPVIRGSMLIADGVPSGGAFTKFVRGWSGRSRRLVGGLYLVSHRKAIQATGRSVVEGLGIPADNSQLYTAGLERREAYYRGQRYVAACREKPLPPVDIGNPLQKEWARVVNRGLPGGRIRRWLREYVERCADIPWTERFWLTREEARNLWWKTVKLTGLERVWDRRRRMLPLLTRLLGRKGKLHQSLREPVRHRKEKMAWVPRGESGFSRRKRGEPVRFVPARLGG